jgi:cytochrome c oxidase cbb3-type subunit 4
MLEMQGLFNTLWVVWFFLLFGGILVWTLRPSKRTEWQQRGSMIFQDDESGRR